MNVSRGDLAIVIKSLAGNEGKIGEVLHINNEYTAYFGETYWDIKFPTKIKGVIGKSGYIGALPDTWLKPVSGLDLSIFTKSKERENK